MSLLDTLKLASGMLMVEEDGKSSKLELLPGLSQEQISALEVRLPCSLPNDIRDVLNYTSGFNNSPVNSVDFAGDLSFGFEEAFPYGLPVAEDGLGNFWVIDLVSQSQEWGPLFYVCHDPAVVVYQADSLETFVKDILKFANPPYQADIDRVLQEFSYAIWKNNPNVLSYKSCIDSSDKSLKEFAATLDESYQIIDLRNPKLGDGFSIKTVIKRHKEERIFAYQVRKSFFQKLFGK
jgi:hypothetical protein